MSSDIKLRNFTHEEKLDILKRLQNGMTAMEIANYYGVYCSRINYIMNNKDKIEQSVPKPRKEMFSTFQVVEEQLLRFLTQQSNRGVSVSYSELHQIAKFFSPNLNIPDSKCFGWINRLISKHNVHLGKIWRQPVMQSDAVRKWLAEVWPNFRAQFTDDQIFTMGEYDASYQSSEMALQYKLDKSTGDTLTNKLTVVIAANMTGTVKKNLYIIGDTELIENLTVPVKYEYSPNAEMTPNLYLKWLYAWDTYLTEKKQKILLLVDNHSTHVQISDLKSVALLFLPPTVTCSPLKPHKGIIQEIESKCLTVLKFSDFEMKNNDDSVRQNITQRTAIKTLCDAWEQITPCTIQKCFITAGFIEEGVNSTLNLVDTHIDSLTTNALDLVNKDFEENEIVTSKKLSIEETVPVFEIKIEIQTDNDNEYMQSESESIEDSENAGAREDVISVPSTSKSLMSPQLLNAEVQDTENAGAEEQVFSVSSASDALMTPQVLNTEVQGTENDDAREGKYFLLCTEKLYDEERAFSVPSTSGALMAVQVLETVVRDTENAGAKDEVFSVPSTSETLMAAQGLKFVVHDTENADAGHRKRFHFCFEEEVLSVPSASGAVMSAQVLKSKVQDTEKVGAEKEVFSVPSSLEASILAQILKPKVQDSEKAVSEDEVCSSPSAFEALWAAQVLNQFVHTNLKDHDLKLMMSHIHDTVHQAYYKK